MKWVRYSKVTMKRAGDGEIRKILRKEEVPDVRMCQNMKMKEVEPT